MQYVRLTVCRHKRTDQAGRMPALRRTKPTLTAGDKLAAASTRPTLKKEEIHVHGLYLNHDVITSQKQYVGGAFKTRCRE